MDSPQDTKSMTLRPLFIQLLQKVPPIIQMSLPTSNNMIEKSSQVCPVDLLGESKCSQAGIQD